MTLQKAIYEAVELIRKYGDTLRDLELHCGDEADSYFTISTHYNAKGYFEYAMKQGDLESQLIFTPKRLFSAREILSERWIVKAKLSKNISVD